MAKALGRHAPPDWKHVNKFPLTAETTPADPVPGVIGINWYPEFDQPELVNGRWWVARNGIKSRRPRGGHCVACKARTITDVISWQLWYNQVNEGICVGEGCSRMMSEFNRVKYQPRWLYDRCKERDGIPNEEGTYVRSGLEVLLELGHVIAKRGEEQGLNAHQYDTRQPDLKQGVQAFRWARSVDDFLNVLGFGRFDYCEILNSWGQDYPRVVRVPAAALERLFNEDGEFGVVVDK